MKEPDWASHRAEGHRAIGRYFAEFSQLVSVMDRNLTDYLKGCGVPPEISRLPFSVMPADTLTNVYFEVAKHAYEHDDKERRVATRLRTAVLDELPFRNDLAHGELTVGAISEDSREGTRSAVPPILLRTKPGRKSGATVTLFLDDLDARSDWLLDLATYVDLYAAVCIRQNTDGRIRDYIRLGDEKQLVPGPKHPGFPPHDQPSSSRSSS